MALASGPLFAPRIAPWIALIGWLGSRTLLILAAAAVAQIDGTAIFDVMVKWDAQLFADLAQAGYPEGDIPSNTGDFTKAALFPGLPLLLAGFKTLGVSYGLAGLIISLIGSGLAALALYRLARGGVAGALTVLAWSVAPVAVFSFVGYTESIFLAAALWAWLAARRDRWWLAALLAGLACTFRISGLFLIGALALFAVWGYDQPRWRDYLTRTVRRRLAWLVFPALVLAAYAAYLRLRYGTWTAWFNAQTTGWNRDLHWPWEALRTTLCAAYIGPCNVVHDASNVWIFRAEIIAVIVGIAVTIIMLWRRRVAEAGWMGVQMVAFTCQTWFISVARDSLLWFPLWTLFGEAGAAKLSGRWWWIRLCLIVAWLFTSTLLMVAWAVRFYRGAWSG